MLALTLRRLQLSQPFLDFVCWRRVFALDIAEDSISAHSYKVLQDWERGPMGHWNGVESVEESDLKLSCLGNQKAPRTRQTRLRLKV